MISKENDYLGLLITDRLKLRQLEVDEYEWGSGSEKFDACRQEVWDQILEKVRVKAYVRVIISFPSQTFNNVSRGT